MVFTLHRKINGRTIEQPLTFLCLYLMNRVTVTKKISVTNGFSQLIVKFVKQKPLFSHCNSLFTPQLLNNVGTFY